MRQLLLLFFCAGTARGAIAFVQARPPAATAATCASSSGSATSQACSFSALPTAGNAVWVGIASVAGTVTVADNQTGSPNAYTQQATGLDGTTTRAYKWFAATNITVNTGTFTVTATVPASFVSVNIVEISGQSNTSFLDGATSTGNNVTPFNTPLACGTLAPTAANGLILAGFNSPGFTGTMSMSAGSPDGTTYTLRSNQNNSSCCEASGAGTGPATTAGNYKPQFVSSTPAFGSSVCTAVAIKAAGAGAAKVPHRVTQGGM